MKRALIGAALVLVALAIAWSVRWMFEDAAPPSVTVERQGNAGEGSRDQASSSLASEDERVSGTDAASASSIDSRSTAARPARSITLFGRVKNIVAPESKLPEFEIKVVIGGRVHRARVAPGEDYRVSGLPPGRARVRIDVRGFDALSEDHDILADPLEQKLNFYLVPKKSIYLRVLSSDGRPLLAALQADGTFAAPPEITIVATPDEPASLPFVDTPAYSGYANGRVVLSLKPLGWETTYEYARIFELREELPAYLSACRGSTILDSQLVASPSSDITFRIALDALRANAGSAHLRVVAYEDGRLLDDARVRLGVARDPRIPRTEPIRTTVGDVGDDLPRTGGDVTLGDLDPGPYTLTLTAPGRERLSMRVSVAPGAPTELGTFRVARSAAIAGEVVAASGPVERAHVVLTPILGDDRDPRAVAEQSITDADGRFRFEHLGARSYVLRAHAAESVARPMTVDASNGDVAVHVVLEPGTLVFVRFDREFPVDEGTGAEHTVSVFDEKHALVAQTPMTDAGAAQMRLIRGSYSFEVSRRGTVVARGTFEVGTETMDVLVAR